MAERATPQSRRARHSVDGDTRLEFSTGEERVRSHRALLHRVCKPQGITLDAYGAMEHTCAWLVAGANPADTSRSGGDHAHRSPDCCRSRCRVPCIGSARRSGRRGACSLDVTPSTALIDLQAVQLTRAALPLTVGRDVSGCVWRAGAGRLR